MIYFYEGVPGSGKSLHLVKSIYEFLIQGRNVITNLKINERRLTALAKKEKRDIEKMGHLVCVNPSEFEFGNNSILKQSTRKIEYSYIKGLYQFAENFHVLDDYGEMKEHQTVLVLDEIDDYYLSENYKNPDRPEWARFYRMHRHYGYDVILCSQTDGNLDKKIRGILQTRVSHVDFVTYKGVLKFIAKLRGGHLFVCNEYLYAIKNKKDAHITMYTLNDWKKYGKLYSSTAR